MNILLAFASFTRATAAFNYLHGSSQGLAEGCRQKSGWGAAEAGALGHCPAAAADLHPRQHLCQHAAGPARQTDPVR